MGQNCTGSRSKTLSVDPYWYAYQYAELQKQNRTGTHTGTPQLKIAETIKSRDFCVLKHPFKPHLTHSSPPLSPKHLRALEEDKRRKKGEKNTKIKRDLYLVEIKTLVFQEYSSSPILFYSFITPSPTPFRTLREDKKEKEKGEMRSLELGLA